MRIISLLPFANIDWSATGSMLSAIGTLITCFFAIIIAFRQNKLTKQIASKKLKQTEQELRIALYDKRYEIYIVFSYYMELGPLLTDEQISSPFDGSSIPKICILPNSIINRIDNTSRQKDLFQIRELEIEKKKLLQSKNSSNQLIEIQNRIKEIERRIYFEDLSLCSKAIQTIELAKFCFNEKIAEVMIDYVKHILSFESSKNIDRCYKSLIDNVLPFYEKAKKIEQEVENELKLAYDKLD